MDEIEVVIRIPEEWIEQFKAFKHPSTLETIILQGTVLPKGHGRIIDTNEILKPFVEYGEKKCNQWKVGLSGLKVMLLKQTKAIIEADKEEKND